MRIDAIILAAGLSTRMGRNKLLLPFRGKPILQHVIDLAAALHVGGLVSGVILVSRAATLAGVRTPPSFRVLENPDPARGKSSSLHLGLAEARGDGFLFLQGDQPLLDPETVSLILSKANPETIVVPVHGGAPSSPVFFPSRFKADLLRARGDKGGPDVRDRHAGARLDVQIPDPAPLWNVNTEKEYQALLRGDFS